MAQQNQPNQRNQQQGRSTSPDVNSASQQKDSSAMQKGSQWSDKDQQKSQKSPPEKTMDSGSTRQASPKRK